jgi:hypothetical protein
MLPQIAVRGVFRPMVTIQQAWNGIGLVLALVGMLLLFSFGMPLVAGLAAGIALASHAVAAALADSAHVHVSGERHLIWRCLENGGCG